jgi:hypothetical protein
MRKTIFAVVALLIATPAMAAVDISVADGPGPNDITISFDASGEANRVRAFALDVVINDPCMEVIEVNCVNADYYVYPGSISIDGSGTVTDWGTCQCSGSYPGTLAEPNAITIEMGSLYVGEANAPAASGDLVIITLAGCDDGGDGANVDITENAIRGGVVMEDPDEVVTVNSPGGTVSPALEDCRIPNCWDATFECGGQPLGDSDCDGSVNFIDLGRLKVSFFTNYGDPGYDCCSDYNQDCSVNFLDLGILKVNFFTSGHAPATGEQSCDGIGCP